MGCATSVLKSDTESHSDKSSNVKNTAVNEAEYIEATMPPPRVPMMIGAKCHSLKSGARNVVFLFGGPGTMKGAITEELVSEFGFQLITTADIVLNYLPNKVANTVTTAREIEDLIRADPSILTLDWILHLISAKISTSNHNRFLIDIVPNLTSILKVDSLSKENYNSELATFERRHPILFGLNLVVNEENLLKNVPGIAMHKEIHSDSANPSTSTDEGSQDDEKNKNFNSSRASDEADLSRMEKRNELYNSRAGPFLRYFESTERLCSVMVGTRRKAFICKRIAEFMKDHEITPTKQVVRVVLFVLSESQIEGLDPYYYKMLKVRLSTIVNNTSESLEQMIAAVRRYIMRTSSSSANHLVILDCLNTKSKNTLRRLNFVEVRESYLDRYIHIKSTQVKGQPFRKPFKAISSTSDEVCLFPDEISMDLAKKIGFCFSYGIGDADAISTPSRTMTPLSVVTGNHVDSPETSDPIVTNSSITNGVVSNGKHATKHNLTQHNGSALQLSAVG